VLVQVFRTLCPQDEESHFCTHNFFCTTHEAPNFGTGLERLRIKFWDLGRSANFSAFGMVRFRVQ
jgi:hypothetical protein